MTITIMPMPSHINIGDTLTAKIYGQRQIYKVIGQSSVERDIRNRAQRRKDSAVYRKVHK